MLDLWDNPLILYRDRCPSRSCSRWREWSRSNGVLSYGFEVKERPLVWPVTGSKSVITARTFAICAICPGSGSKSIFSGRLAAFVVAIGAANARFLWTVSPVSPPAGTRNESTRLTQTLRLFGYLLRELPRSGLQERAAATGGRLFPVPSGFACILEWK